MTRRKQAEQETQPDEMEIPVPVVEDPKPAAKPVEKPPEPLYVPEMWKGVVQVYRCTKCGVHMNNEDDMKLHVLSHYPAREQNSILERLMMR